MNVVRWTARILALLLVGVFLVFMVGQGFNPLALKGAEIAQSAVLLVALAGMLLLWRWELPGGTMVVAGMAAFYAINFAAAGRFPGHFVFPLCFVPGVLAIICGWSRPTSHSAPTRVAKPDVGSAHHLGT